MEEQQIKTLIEECKAPRVRETAIISRLGKAATKEAQVEYSTTSKGDQV
jgi:hypothetical protein